MSDIKKNTNVSLHGKIRVQLFDEAGELKLHHEIVNTFMNVGDAHVADQLADSPGEAAMGWMAIGTSSTAKAITDTTLNSELDRNALNSGYPEQGSGANDNDVIYKAAWAAGDGTGAITEAGIFNASSAGTMLAATTFDVINKGASDTLTVTWTVTVG